MQSSISRTPAFCRKSGYKPELAWTLCDYAKALLDTGGPDDREGPPSCSTKGTTSRHSSACGLCSPPLHHFGSATDYDWLASQSGCRELEILGLLSLGRTNKEIADALCISSNTVAVHVARVLSKTGSSNRTEAASYAVRHHLIGETRA